MTTVFVATDEANFLESLGESFCGRRVISTESERSRGRLALHLTGPGSMRRAQEALMDAHLLARTQLVVKTASALSAWAGFLAPELPVLVLNDLYTGVRLPWFPVEARSSVEMTASDIARHAATARARAQTRTLPK
ncbi:conserved hypothetical protein [Opitutus terrae PB90-1]|uniref:Uncharacterized protein n=1 Tax=Opitutus terrae (strain DSM 11246 / JCM 15787 / PB90-1) TaxID=452637 RepID=B1ZSN6_OPITP|nr:conserved hypothetical protein [Opitutus terrae PB90-1]